MDLIASSKVADFSSDDSSRRKTASVIVEPLSSKPPSRQLQYRGRPGRDRRRLAVARCSNRTSSRHFRKDEVRKRPVRDVIAPSIPFRPKLCQPPLNERSEYVVLCAWEGPFDVSHAMDRSAHQTADSSAPRRSACGRCPQRRSRARRLRRRAGGAGLDRWRLPASSGAALPESAPPRFPRTARR